MSSIQVIIQFDAKPERSDEFSNLLKTVLRDLPAVSGCRGVRMFNALDNACRYTLLEEWDSVEAHQAHLDRVVTSGGWDVVSAHLSSAPTSQYVLESVE